MNAEQFDKLARADRVTLLSALTLLWQNGRESIQSRDISTLTAGCMSGLGTLYTEKKIQEIAAICKELACLEPAELIRCLRCEGMEMQDPGADEEGVCPVCGGELEYECDKPQDDGGFYEWTCFDCGATGKEGYNKVFDRHYDVYDGDGNPYPDPSEDARDTALTVPETAECPPSPSTAEVLVVDGGRTNTLPPADVVELSAHFPRDDWRECFWGFTCFSRQNYAKVVPLDGADEIMLGIQCVQGGCLCEMAICWHMISNKPTPRLEMFDEAWPLFRTPTFVSVLEQLTQMSQNHIPTPDEVSALLIAQGFTDQSDRPLGTSNG